MTCLEQILEKVQIYIVFGILIFDSCKLILTLCLSELSYRDELGLRLKLFSFSITFYERKHEKNVLEQFAFFCSKL